MLTKIRNSIMIAGLGSILFLAGDTAWAERSSSENQDENCTCKHHNTKNMYVRKDCTCALHKDDAEVDEALIGLEPEQDEMYKQEYPDYLPGESEVLRGEPGPDLSRTQPFENNPYK